MKTVWVVLNIYAYGESIHVCSSEIKALKLTCDIISETLDIIKNDTDLKVLIKLLKKDPKAAIKLWNDISNGDYFRITEEEVR